MCEKHNSVRNKIYPLKLEGAIVPTIWGGKKLYQKYKKGNPDISTGEMWELSAQGERQCRIKNGIWAGYTLKDYISFCGNGVVSDCFDGQHFPLLIKFIDAADKLSVQVHPDDEYAQVHENSPGKTELWYVISAEPGAEIVYGLNPDIEVKQIAPTIKSGNFESLLNKVRVVAGDVFYVPAGLVHSIGKGIVIAEIQQNSNLTYRLFDYNRCDDQGIKRELHIDKAVEVIKQYSPDEINRLQFEYAAIPFDSNLLSDNRYFTVHMLDIVNEYSVTNLTHCFNVLLCIDGSGCFVCNNNHYEINAGDCWFIPSGCNMHKFIGNLKILHISPQFKKRKDKIL